MCLLAAAANSGCGKSSVCDQIAARNEAEPEAIESVIMDDYARFAAITEAELGRSPPSRVERAARASAKQWRETLTDPGLRQTCVSDWRDERVARLALCLDLPDAADYGACLLAGLEIPLMVPTSGT